MSRLESGFIEAKKDWCDIEELVHSTINQLEEGLRNHKVIIDIAENLPLFKLDFGLIQQALINLISNAITYTPSNSTIRISAKTSRQNDMESIIFTIEDNGPGFPKDETEKVFEKFYRLKTSATGGTGLGLSIVKGFVEAHQGIITLSNSDSGGARFVIKIPAETSYINNQKNE